MALRKKNPKKKSNPTIELAIWFWEEIRGLEWNWGHPLCRRMLKEAKNLVNPTEGIGVTVEEVKRTVECIIKDKRRSDPCFQLTSLSCVSWKARDGQFYFEKANTIPPAPPIYEELALQDWNEKYAERIADENEKA